MIISPQGGEPRALTQIDGIGAAWSHDSQFIAVTDRPSSEKPFQIDRVSVSTGERRQLTFPPPGWWGDIESRFSPDGKAFAFIRYSTKGRGDVYLSTANGGEVRRLTNIGNWLNGIAWTTDSREIVFNACLEWCGLFRIDVTANQPVPIRIVAALPDAQHPSIGRTADGTERLVFESGAMSVKLLQARRDKPDEDEKALAQSTRGEEVSTFSPDGRTLAFSSRRSGSADFWLATVNGPADPTNLRQLTFKMGGTLVVPFPAWSPDGNRLSFASDVRGRLSVYTVGIEGGEPRRLTKENFEEGFPSWSRDGNFIYFRSKRSGSPALWKSAADGSGLITAVVHGLAMRGVESLDGQELYFVRGEDGSKFWRVPAKGGSEEEIPGSPKVKVSDWAVAEEGIFFLDSQDFSKRGKMPIGLFRPRDGSSELVRWIPRRGLQGNLTTLRDGSVFVWTRWRKESDIVRLDNFR